MIVEEYWFLVLTFNFIFLGASFFISDNNLSPKPWKINKNHKWLWILNNIFDNILFLLTDNKVEPPASTILWYNFFRTSKSDFCMEYTNASCKPSHSSPIKSGWNKTSGARKRAGPI